MGEQSNANVKVDGEWANLIYGPIKSLDGGIFGFGQQVYPNTSDWFPAVQVGTATTYFKQDKAMLEVGRNNWGTATILSGQTSVTFAHELYYGAPSVVVLGPTHAEVADAVWSADDTNSPSPCPLRSLLTER